MAQAVAGVAAAILAGGQATRMGGAPKSFLTVGGRRVIDRQLEVLRPMFDELLLIANDPGPYAGLGLRIVPDEVSGQGPLAGILAAIEAARAPRVVVVACDMPHLQAAALALVADPAADEDVVVPVVGGHEEPLHARYARTCASAIRARLAAQDRKITRFFADVRVRRVAESALRAIDPSLAFLANCNTPEDLAQV